MVYTACVGGLALVSLCANERMILAWCAERLARSIETTSRTSLRNLVLPLTLRAPPSFLEKMNVQHAGVYGSSAGRAKDDGVCSMVIVDSGGSIFKVTDITAYIPKHLWVSKTTGDTVQDLPQHLSMNLRRSDRLQCLHSPNQS